MSGLFYRRNPKSIFSSKSMDIPSEQSQIESNEPKHSRYRAHFKRFRRGSNKLKPKFSLVKSLPSSFSQSSEIRSPTSNGQTLLHVSGSAVGIGLDRNRFSTDEESSSVTSGSGLIHMHSVGGGRTNGTGNNNYNYLMAPETTVNSGFSGNGASLTNRTTRTSPSLKRMVSATPSKATSAITNLLESSPLVASHNFVTEDELQVLLRENDRQRHEQQQLHIEIEQIRSQYQTESLLLQQSIQDERERCERLEEQMNDLTELHQNEIENLKQLISDMEEKVSYQSEDRLRDINESLENCHTRISKMEHQHNQHLQQLITLDSLENSNARQLLLKLINVLLTVLQVILLLVATFASIIIPFFRTRIRVINTLFSFFVLFLVYSQRTQLLRVFRNHLDHPLLHLISFNDTD